MPPTPHQRALGQAQLTLAQQFGIGGDRWRVIETNQIVTGYLVPIQPPVDPTLGSLGYSTDTDYEWRSRRDNVAQGHTIVSQRDTAIRAVVTGAANTDRGIVVTRCERVSP